MILWDELEEIKEKSIENEQILEVQLLFNGYKVTSFLEYNEFIYNISLDILELNSNKYNIVDKTIENVQVKSQIRYIQVQVQLRKKKGRQSINDLKDLFELNIETKKISFLYFDVISTNNKMTYDELVNIVGLSISCMEVESFKIYKDNIIHIKLKDS